MTEPKLSKLPNGWVWTKLEDISEKIEKVNPRNHEKEELIYIDISSIDNTNQKIISPKRYLGKDVPSRARQLIKAGDILFSTVRTYLKNIAIVGKEYDGQVASTGFCVIRPNKSINDKFIFYFSQTDLFINSLNQIQRGTSYPAVRDSDVFSQPFPLAPLPEQRRIVARIEELFSRLDAGVEALQRAKAQLQRYRQAVLKAAVEGRLTEEWRKANPEVEPAEKLLKIMLKERRERWEKKQLEKFTGSGSGRKTLKNQTQKYKDPILIMTPEFTKFPKSWCWASAEQCTTTITDGEHITPERSKSGILLLSARNIQDGYLSLEDVDFVPNNIYEKLKQRLIIEPGDVLMSCSGSVGRSCVAPENLEFALVRSVAILKPLMNMGNYLSYAIRSPLLQGQINEKKTQTAQANIFQGKIRTLMFPLPPLLEQQVIVREIYSRLSILDEVDKDIDKIIRDSHHLRQSILKSAFKGMLVSQNPNDGPASTILTQIMENRLKLNSSKNKPKTKRITMSKTRRSLYDVLASTDEKLTPKELFDQSGQSIESIDEFYEELREEIFIKSRIEEIRLNQADIYLKVISNENT